MILADAPDAPIPLPPGQTSEKDPQGRYTINVDFPGMPAQVQPGQEYFKSFEVPIGPDINVLRITEFIGLDRGDCAEVDIEVRSPGGQALLQRSEHKETLGIFDSWKTHDVRYKSSPGKETLIFILRGHPTAGASVKLHWGARVELQAR